MKQLAKNRPVAVLAAVRAVLLVLVGFGVLKLTDADIETVVTAVGALWAALEIIITAWQERVVTPVGKASENAAKVVHSATGSVALAERVRDTIKQGKPSL